MQSTRRFSSLFLPFTKKNPGSNCVRPMSPIPIANRLRVFFPRFTMFGFWIFHRRRRSRTGRDHTVGGGSFGGGVYFGVVVFRVTRKLSSRETSSARIVDRRSRRLPRARAHTGLDGRRFRCECERVVLCLATIFRSVVRTLKDATRRDTNKRRRRFLYGYS